MIPGVSIPPIDIVIPELPLAASPGALVVTDPRGTHPYLYVLLSATGWYRVDVATWAWQRLADPPNMTFGAGTCAAWDASRGRIWVLSPGAAGPVFAWFGFFDLATETWNAGGAPNVATLNALLGAVWATDGALAHPCTDIAAATSDDFLYLVGNGGAAAYRYAVAGLTWTAVTVRGAVAGAGCTLDWLWSYSQDRLYSLDGGGLATQRSYGIAGDAWAPDAPVPAWTVLPAAGTCACASTDGARLLVRLNATGQVYSYDPATDLVAHVGHLYGPDGAAGVGGKLAAYRAGGREYLVALVHGSKQVQRIRLA